MSFVYGLVGFETTPLAEYETAEGNYAEIGHELLGKIGHDDSRTVFEQGQYLFSGFGSKTGLTILVLSKSSVDVKTRFFVINEIQSKWQSKYGSKAATMRPMEKSAEFRGEIQRIFTMMESPTQAKIQQINKNISDAQEIMTQNLSAAIARGEQLNVMEQKAEDIRSSSSQFQRDARKVKNEMCCRRYMYYILGGIVILAIIAVIVIIALVVSKKKKKISGDNGNSTALLLGNSFIDQIFHSTNSVK